MERGESVNETHNRQMNSHTLLLNFNFTCREASQKAVNAQRNGEIGELIDHPNRRKERGEWPLMGEQVMFREDQRALRNVDGDVIVFDSVCLGVMLTPCLSSCDESQSSLLDETPGEGIYDN